jgi:uncharacterized protein YeeX (DUF496 family)
VCDVRGKLDKAKEEQIESLLPDLTGLANRVLSLSPVSVSLAFMPEGSIPVAVPCLHDALHVTFEARYGLGEAIRHLEWYRKASPTGPNERAAQFFGRFYATAAASCLYAAAEDLANAIIEMYELDRQRIDPENAKQISLQSKVGKYLSKNMASDSVSNAVCSLAQSDSWNKTVKWRNNWVHDQSPIKGFGITYKREKRWKPFVSASGAEGYEFSWGGGDQVEASIDDVLEFVRLAFSLFVSTFEKVLSRYFDILSKAGITFDEDGRLSIPLFRWRAERQ